MAYQTKMPLAGHFDDGVTNMSCAHQRSGQARSLPRGPTRPHDGQHFIVCRPITSICCFLDTFVHEIAYVSKAN